MSKIHTPVQKCSAGEFARIGGAAAASEEIFEDQLNDKGISMRGDLQHRSAGKGMALGEVCQQAAVDGFAVLFVILPIIGTSGLKGIIPAQEGGTQFHAIRPAQANQGYRRFACRSRKCNDRISGRHNKLQPSPKGGAGQASSEGPMGQGSAPCFLSFFDLGGGLFVTGQGLTALRLNLFHDQLGQFIGDVGIIDQMLLGGFTALTDHFPLVGDP